MSSHPGPGATRPPLSPQRLAEPPPRFHDEAWHTPLGRFVRELIFGLNDGIISTVGFLAGVTATVGDLRTIVVGGFAAAMAGAVAMGIGAYVSAKSQRAFFRAEIAREAWEIEHMPERESQEIREIYTRHGFTPDEIDMIVRRVTSNPELWLQFMTREELGITEEFFDSPVRGALVTSLAFLAGALLLLIPYLFDLAPTTAFPAAAAVAVVALLVTGAAKTWVTKEPMLRASLEMAGLGILAAAIGLALGRLVGIAV
jgi:VIT1/CCC1 family predicted Fe2+/Mn2+ transporter